MRTKSLLVAACCGLVLVTVLVACGGGGDRLSAPDYVRTVSTICARGNRQIARIELPALTSGPGARRAMSHAMARVVVVQRATIDRLREVRPPERLAETVQKWIALLDQGADELERMGDELRAGRSAAALAFGAKAGTLLDRARAVTAPMRVTSCRGPELPTV